MHDPTTPQGRIITAALALAGEKPWAEVTLSQIAERGGMPLAEVLAHAASKSEILTAFTRAIDEDVLRLCPKPVQGDAPRDRLFEVVMCRFDALAPYKTALRSIAFSGTPDFERLGALVKSQRWMLEGAGISTDGIEGGLRVAGLCSIYVSVFRTWLADTDAGHARTMAALDRRLRRGEQALRRLKDLERGLASISAVMAGFACGRSRDAKPDGTPMSGPSSAPPAAP